MPTGASYKHRASPPVHEEAVNYANWYSVEFDGDLILEGSRDRTDVVTR
jgi:hypothetical protein